MSYIVSLSIVAVIFDIACNFMRNHEKFKAEAGKDCFAFLRLSPEEKEFLKQEDIHALQRYLTALEEKNIEELLPIYGTTLCSAMLIPKIGFFAMQLGDGNIAIKYKDEPFVTAVADDKNCFLNQTTSLCDKDSQNEIRFFASQKIPECVFCCTDGFENSFKDEAQLMGVYQKVFEFQWIYGC